MYSHPLSPWSLLCQCLQGAPIPAPVSADAALLHLLLVLGCSPLCWGRHSQTPEWLLKFSFHRWETSPSVWVLLTVQGQVVAVPSWWTACRLGWSHLQISCVQYQYLLCRAQPSAGLACPWLRHQVSQVGLTQHPSHGVFYLLKALGLLTIFLKTFSFFFFSSKESAVEHLTEARIAETCCFTRHSSCPRGKKW